MSDQRLVLRLHTAISEDFEKELERHFYEGEGFQSRLVFSSSRGSLSLGDVLGFQIIDPDDGDDPDARDAAQMLAMLREGRLS